MNITADNYKSVFSVFNDEIEKVQANGNANVEDALAKLKEAFAQKERGSDILLADNSVLKIGIVGQVKAGKSSFLNSLFFNGENILPRASTPMTAGLTVLKYGEENKFVVEYFNSKEWQYFVDKAAEYDKLIEMGKAQNPGFNDSDIEKMLNIDSTKKSAKEMVSKCSRAALNNVQKVSKKDEKIFGQYTELQNILEDYVGANGKMTSIVKCLTIELNDERLNGIQIVDTPGVNDPVVSREMRTREFLQECHGVFFLSLSTQFFGATDVSFLVNRIGSQGIGTVVLIGSMLDAGLIDASGKYPDDLGNALEYVKSSLECQYRANISTSDFNGNDPELDFSSGIGYSIAQKGRSRWDSMEAHVVSRMCELYPSFFDTDESIKEMFSALANIDGDDGIRAKYLEGLFKANMDKIIRQKLNSYFGNASSELSKEFDKQKNSLQTQLTNLQNCDNPEDRRKAMMKLVENMKRDILSIMSRADSRADKAVKEVMNSYSMNWDGNIPTITATEDCRRESTFWRNEKHFSVNAQLVDINSLAVKVQKVVADGIKNVASAWEKKNSDIRKFISDSIIEFISEQEKQDMENKIDGRMMKSVLDDTLDQMSSEATISVGEFMNQAASDISNLLIGYDEVSTVVGEADEAQARREIENRVRKQKTTLNNQIRDYLNGLYTDVQVMVKKAALSSLICIKDKKGQFINHISEEINTKIDELEVQIKNREENIKTLTSAIETLNQIQKKL